MGSGCWRLAWGIFVFASAALFGEIRECDCLQDLLEVVDEDTFVVLDLDNTLIEPIQTLGSDQWVEAMLEQFISQGCSVEEALGQLLPLWRRIISRTEVRLVEEEGAEVVAKLQRRQLPCIALTARGMATSQSTQEQLDSVGIDMSQTAPEVEGSHSGYYYRGVLHCDGGHKGRILLSFFQAHGQMPKRVVCIDDKERNLVKVAQCLEAEGVEFLGLRYSGSDEAVACFNHALAHVQLQVFEMLISDEFAQAILEGEYEEAWHYFLLHVHPTS